jgi:AmmeMemoRadiSam system protein A
VAEEVDRQILSGLTSLDANTLREANEKILASRPAGLSTAMCGLDAASCMTRAAPLLGITEGKVVNYSHSGKTSGDPQRVVGYAAAVFTGEGKISRAAAIPPLTLAFSSQSRKELISMAREAVQAATAGNWVSHDPSRNPELQVKAGCFVTLKNQGRLRGCIGCFQTDEPLWKTVREMAVSSATMDARFRHDPITTGELPHLDVEISVLSPLRPIARPLEELKLGRDGIVIQDKGRKGTFLPQVAQQTGWSLEEFLGHCSHDKAGIGWDGWKSPTARIFAYTATIVSEKDFPGSDRE